MGLGILNIIPPVGLGSAIVNNIKSKKKNAEYAKWVDKYPVVDNCASMDSLIAEATKQLDIETKEFYAIKGIQIAKKAKAKRERDALRDYINDMKNYLKDLQCGISSPAPTATPTPAPANTGSNLTTNAGTTTVLPATVVSAGIPVPDSPLAQNVEVPASNNAAGASSAPMNNQTGSSTSATLLKKLSDNKKTVYWIVGGVALVGAAIYFMRKK